MPSQYRRDAPRLKAEIVARVRGGETVRSIGAGAGMPGAQTVRNWARADAPFAAELAGARRATAWARLYAYDEARAEAFLARARAGETIRSLLGAPGMPSAATYRYWKATQGEFAEGVFALRQRRAAEVGEMGRRRRHAWDPALGDRIIVGLHKGLTLDAVLAGDPDLPCRATLARWRREQPRFDRVLQMIFAAWRTRRPSAALMRELLTEEIVDHIIEGGSFASYSRLPGGPSRTTLRRWLRADPDFAAAVARACDFREDWYYEQIYEIAQRTPPGPVREMNRAVGPLLRHLVRLRHRPGAKHVRQAADRSV